MIPEKMRIALLVYDVHQDLVFIQNADASGLVQTIPVCCHQTDLSEYPPLTPIKLHMKFDRDVKVGVFDGSILSRARDGEARKLTTAFCLAPLQKDTAQVMPLAQMGQKASLGELDVVATRAYHMFNAVKPEIIAQHNPLKSLYEMIDKREIQDDAVFQQYVKMRDYYAVHQEQLGQAPVLSNPFQRSQRYSVMTAIANAYPEQAAEQYVGIVRGLLDQFSRGKEGIATAWLRATTRDNREKIIKTLITPHDMGHHCHFSCNPRVDIIQLVAAAGGHHLVAAAREASIIALQNCPLTTPLRAGLENNFRFLTQLTVLTNGDSIINENNLRLLLQSPPIPPRVPS